LVRSSYRAEQALARNNAGLNNAGLESPAPTAAGIAPTLSAVTGARRDS
jgi:hypothetical protein